MKRLVIVCSVFILAAVGSAQWLEKVIWLNDSIVGLEEPLVAFHNPVTNRMYFAGPWTERTQIFDATTRQKFGYIDTVEGCGGFAHCYHSNRIYASSPDMEQILILDDRTDTITEVLDADWPLAMAYNGEMDKLYICTDDQVLVFNPGPDTVLDTIQLHDYATRIVWDSVHNRVYCLGPDWGNYPVVAIDCETDSVVATLFGMDQGYDILVHPELPKLYCLGTNDSTRRNEIWVYDTDSLVARKVINIPLSSAWDYGRLFLNPVSNYLYASYFEEEFEALRRDYGYPDDSVAVVNCATDSLVGFIGLPEDCWPSAFAVNLTDNKAYLASWDIDSVAVLGVPDSITNWIPASQPVTGLGWNPTDNEVYLAEEEGFVWIVDGATNSIIDSIDYEGIQVRAMTWNPSGNKLYVGDYNGVGIVGQGDTIEKWVPVEWCAYEGFLGFFQELNRLYLGNHDWQGHGEVYVYDCNTDSVILDVPLPIWYAHAGLVLPEYHKLYLPGYHDTTAVYDLHQDSVVATRTGFGNKQRYNPRNSLVYGYRTSMDGIAVIDPQRDSIVTTVPSHRIRDLTVNTTDNEVYFAVYNVGKVYVLDGQTHQVTDSIITPRPVHQLVWVETVDKLYAIDQSAVYVIDCPTRQLIRTIPADIGYYRSSVVHNRNKKLYIGGSHDLFVIHCRLDSIVARFENTPGYDLTWNMTDNRVYASEYNSIWVFCDSMTGIAAEPERIEPAFSLRTRANPAKQSVTFLCQVPAGHQAYLALFDATGRMVWNCPVAGKQPQISVTWKGIDRLGRKVPTGIYFARLESGTNRTVAKVVLER